MNFIETHFALLEKKPVIQCTYKEEMIGLYNGLCCLWCNNTMLKHHKDFDLLKPNWDDIVANWTWWANMEGEPNAIVYNELRQNIMLFLAAINGEL